MVMCLADTLITQLCLFWTIAANCHITWLFPSFSFKFISALHNLYHGLDLTHHKKGYQQHHHSPPAIRVFFCQCYSPSHSCCSSHYSTHYSSSPSSTCSFSCCSFPTLSKQTNLTMNNIIFFCLIHFLSWELTIFLSSAVCASMAAS